LVYRVYRLMIDFSIEKELVNRNYRELTNRSNYYNHHEVERDINHIWLYCKKNDECAMVSLDYDALNEKWLLSYPMKNTKVNYKVTTDTKEEAIDYFRFVLSENSLE